MPAISENIPADTDDVSENVTDNVLTTGLGHILFGNVAGDEQAGGTRFTSIGPAGGDPLDDANLRFGIYEDLVGATDPILEIFVDIDGSGPWVSVTDTPSQATPSTNKASVPGTLTVGSDRTVDITAVLQEWIDDPDYDGDVRFMWRVVAGAGAWEYYVIIDYGATWQTQLPAPMILEGNWTEAGGGAARSFAKRIYQQMLAR